MTSKPILLVCLGVAARIEKRSHHHSDVADCRFYLLYDKRFGMREFLFNLFGKLSPPYLRLLEGENTDANRGVGQVFGFHF